MDAAGARANVDAFARLLYARLFAFLVDACDGPRVAADAFVGVLDVFGFESFAVNGFETLLINYANEALQQHFCDAVFEAELRLFDEEGIAAPAVSPPDAAATVDVLAGRGPPPGLLPKLDEQAATGGDDQRFLASIRRDLGTHPALARTHPKDRATQFRVRHYAATVSSLCRSFFVFFRPIDPSRRGAFL